MVKVRESSKIASPAEDRFISLFCDVFGPKNTKYIYLQHPVVDIYGGRRYIDFAFQSNGEKIAIEIDGETYHNPKYVSDNKYIDDLLKQNSLVYQGWKIYRWTYKELVKTPEKVKDEMLSFLGGLPQFKIFDDHMPMQKGKVIELKDHQKEALDSLKEMRSRGESIGLLYHATGTGKTVTAVSDAKSLGYKTLFLAHRKEIISQAKYTFEEIWPEKKTGLWLGDVKENGHIICGSIQSISNDLTQFNPEEFGYIIIDEAHHAAAKTYKEILSYFKPKFTLGLTATPNRMDGENLLDIFKNIGHKLDLKTAVELGELVPVRCIRVKTNIDLTDVRINGIKYNSKDLENKLVIPDRNNIIIDTYLKFVKDKKTVIFCTSVSHAEEIARLLMEEGVEARAVSGSLADNERKKILKQYEDGDINVLCACDLLNEGWDSPNTEVLFMARPTMSKALYLQQLGRGMRLANGKDYLMVFDFIDNANLFNMPYSIHRIFKIKDYRPGALAIGPKTQMIKEKNLVYKGEKPEVLLDYPVDVMDYELIELFDWQEEVKDMVSELEFVRMVSVQSETVSKYIREGKIKPDLVIPMSTRKFNYFKEDTVEKYAEKFNWELITPANIKKKFMEYISIMDMSYSYKPVFLKGFFQNMDDQGRVNIELIVDYFIDFYEGRREAGLVVEKKRCLYLREYSRTEVKNNILSNPFKRFQDMNFMDYDKDLEKIRLNRHILNKLNSNDIIKIEEHCERKLEEYFS